MRIVTIPNQPIVFERPSELNCLCEQDREPAVYYDVTDIIPLQFRVTPDEDSLNEIDYTVPDVSTNLTISNGLISKTPSYGDGVYAFNGSTFTPNFLYILEINVQDFTGGTIDVYVNATLTLTITAAGNYLITFKQTTDALTFDLEIVFSDNNSSVINLVGVYKFPTIEYQFITLDGTEVIRVPIFDEDNPFINSQTTLKDNTVTLNIAAKPTSAGCYYLELLQPFCELNIVNCSFENLENWTFEGDEGVVFDFNDGLQNELPIDNSITITNTNAPPIRQRSNATITNESAYCLDVDYQITLQWSNNTGLTIAYIVIDYGFGNFEVISQFNISDPSGTFTTDVFRYTAAGGVVLLSLALAPLDAITIESLCSSNDSPVFIRSQKLELKDFSGQCDWLRVGLRNQTDGNGFVFSDSNFVPFSRIEAEIVNANYPTERIANEFNNGERNVQYAERKKVKSLNFGLTDEYTIDFLSTLTSADVVLINGNEYFCEDDDVSLSYSTDLSNWATGTVAVSERYSIIRTR
jgi:hypothetical protein